MRSARTRGFGLLLTLFGMGFLVLTFGAGIDISHIYLVQNELQGELDEIALRAARELDGSLEGLQRAQDQAEWGNADQHRAEWFAFSTDRLKALKAEFAPDPGGPWAAAPREARDYRFVRVSAAAEARLFFLPMVLVSRNTQEVDASSVAGLEKLEPDADAAAYRATAKDPNTSDFGFSPDEVLPISLIETGDCVDILQSRFRLDTDTTSTTYAEYARFGNGQRVVIASVTAGDAKPLGHATLLIRPGIVRSGNCEAAYGGNAPVRNAAKNGAGGPGLYEVRLIR